jgi:CHAT domain-containing protein
MARQWRSFFTAMESLKMKIQNLVRQIFSWKRYRTLSIMLLVVTFLLSSGVLPVRSQMMTHNHKMTKKLTIDSTTRSKVRSLHSNGNYYQACEELITFLGLDAKICSGDLPGSNTVAQISQASNRLTLVDRVEFLRSLGDVFRGIGLLEESEKVLIKSLEQIEHLNANEASIKITGSVHLSLGNTYRSLGNLERDRRSLPQYNYSPWNYSNRSSIAESEVFYKCADAAYQRNIGLHKLKTDSVPEKCKDFEKISNRLTAKDELPENLQIQSQLNRFSLMIDMDMSSQNFNNLEALALELWKKTTSQNILSSLPSSTYAKINLAKSLAYFKQKYYKALGQNTENQIPSWDELIKLLQSAEGTAKTIKEKSYALGNLGGLYEYCSWQGSDTEKSRCKQSIVKYPRQEAQYLTQEALTHTQPSDMPDIAYQWQWQLGRLLEAEYKNTEAINSYERAIKTLESARGNLLAINSDGQFSFRDSIEPAYRELVDLLLKPGKNQDPLRARQLIDNLKLAELENFLKCNLRKDQQSLIEEIQDEKTFVLYPIILKDRLEIIVKSPGKDRKLVSYPVSVDPKTNEKLSSQKIESSIEVFRKEIQRPVSSVKGEQASEKLYDWLIRPIEDHLQLDTSMNKVALTPENVERQDEVKTLVFVLDGSLRKIPIAALYDSQQRQYLVQKYVVAISPSLKLPAYKQQKNLKLLLAGQSQDPQTDGFSSLPNIGGKDGEIDKIETILKKSKIKSFSRLVDTDLNAEKLEDAIKSSAYTVVHLAMHGQFKPDLRDAFLIPAPREKMTFTNLEKILRIRNRDAIELLVFSACETAGGNNRVVLGLSGLTIRSGVRNAVGTLWNVDDTSTSKLMGYFYQDLLHKSDGRPNFSNTAQDDVITVAKALRQAQITLIDEKISGIPIYSPFHWAPFISVGNWNTTVSF